MFLHRKLLDVPVSRVVFASLNKVAISMCMSLITVLHICVLTRFWVPLVPRDFKLEQEKFDMQILFYKGGAPDCLQMINPRRSLLQANSPHDVTNKIDPLQN